jgi:hypothetical protein
MAQERVETDREWQIAADRILLYLRCLHFTVPEDLYLALQIIKKAQLSISCGSANNPLVESMHILHATLSSQGKTEKSDQFLDTWCDHLVHSTPPIRRQSMISEK